MHVHILGICGTFMGGIAALAVRAGFRVTGSDRNVYPPMSTQLEALGIALTEGFDAAQLDPAPDIVIVGNVMTRGQPVVEALLERGLAYASGPEWLSREVLKTRWVLAVAGTRLAETLAMGCWTPLEGFSREARPEALWSARPARGADDFSRFEVLEGGEPRGTVSWSLIGTHNVENALAAIAAARHAGVEVREALDALQGFRGIARRMQLRGEVSGVRVYDDFAHHPTAIATTIDGLRRRVGAARIVAVLEPRSHTMRMGVHRQTLPRALAGADQVWLYTPPDLGWDTDVVLTELGARGHVSAEVDALSRELARAVRPGDHVLIMSNGGFGGLHGKLLAELERSGGGAGSRATA